MKWTEEELNFLRENYPKRVKITEISKRLGKSIHSIKHKATRSGILRPRFQLNRYIVKQPKEVIDRRYYEKNKEFVYRRKMDRRRKLKEEAVNIAGGKCKHCGYNKCLSALEFHHYQKNKENNVGSLLKNNSRQKLLKEADKCILLCANCHREHHYKGA